MAVPARGGALATGFDNAEMLNAPLTEFGVVTEEATAAGGVEIDGVVYAQTGVNTTAVGDVAVAAAV